MECLAAVVCDGPFFLKIYFDTDSLKNNKQDVTVRLKLETKRKADTGDKALKSSTSRIGIVL